jgi:hypothetical protein
MVLPFPLLLIGENDESTNHISKVFVFFAKAIVQFAKK